MFNGSRACTLGLPGTTPGRVDRTRVCQYVATLAILVAYCTPVTLTHNVCSSVNLALPFAPLAPCRLSCMFPFHAYVPGGDGDDGDDYEYYNYDDGDGGDADAIWTVLLMSFSMPISLSDIRY